jgi:hypothetical protein
MPQATHGAPIQRYSDPRLYGDILVRPFREMYGSWMLPVRNPVHPHSNYYVEMGRRSLNALVGVVCIVALSVFPLIGRIVQMIHYHSLAEAKRKKPEAVSYQGMSLPAVKEVSEEEAGMTWKELVQRGWKELKMKNPSASASEALEIRLDPQTTTASEAALRGGELIKGGSNESLDTEIACVVADDVYLSERAITVESEKELQNTLLAQWQEKPKDVTANNDPRFIKAVTELFERNGFRVAMAPTGTDHSLILCADRFVFRPSQVNVKEAPKEQKDK